MAERHLDIRQLSLAGFLIAVGIVYGDIGTSPLYTFKAIIQDKPVNADLALGGASAIFWTLFFQTTLKYVLVTLKADNHGEGGIFSLYTLVRRYRRWLMVPAILGGSFLIADSIITPPISVASAIEGLKMQQPGIRVLPIVIAIIAGLFLLQAMGTARIGKIFGPAMMVWFGMIGVFGLYALLQNPAVLRALNPIFAYRLIAEYPNGFWLLGAVFLCTTGAEALYSDLGHCGRKNIEASWIFVKTTLVLCYFGQAAWLVDHQGLVLGNANPFFAMMPEWMFWPAIIVATMAAVIASQALISGTFTLFNEAMRLNLFPRLTVQYPSEVRGQLYVPAVNWALMVGCIGAVLFFRESKYMEAAFGLSVTLTMLMTTILLAFYLYTRRKNLLYVVGLTLLFLTIEGAFLVANLMKFTHGGYVTMLLGLGLFWIMFTWQYSRNMKNGLLHHLALRKYLPELRALSQDLDVPKFATHLVYLTSTKSPEKVEERILQSIYQNQPKRADLYWLLHIEVTDEPYTMEYQLDVIEPDEVLQVTFFLGFRVVPRINLMFRHVLNELYQSGQVRTPDAAKVYNRNDPAGDYRFMVFDTYLSRDNELPLWKRIPLRLYFLLKNLDLSTQKAFGLEESVVQVEKVPLIVDSVDQLALKRRSLT